MLRRVLVLILLGATALGTPLAAQKGPTAEAELAQGVTYYEQGFVSSAIAQFSKAIELREKYPEAHFWRGLTLIEMNELAFAFASLSRAIQLRKDYPEAHYLIWLALAQSGAADSNRAHEALAAVGKHQVKLPLRMHLKLAEALADRGLLERAVEEFRKVAAMQPPAAVTDSYFVQQLERNVEGIKAEIAQREGNYADGHLKLARALLNRQDYEGAVAAARKAIEQRENFPDAHLFLGSVYLLRKDYENALATLRGFLAKFPNHGQFAAFRSRIAAIRQAGALPPTPVVNNPDTQAKLTPPAALPVTEAARERKVSGAVTVEATFTGAGTVENPVIVQGLGYGLDERAVQAIMAIRFEPAVKDGKPVAVRQKVQVNFSL